jgi:NADH:ubiquinone oxidoreductase subunit 1 (chain H)
LGNFIGEINFDLSSVTVSLVIAMYATGPKEKLLRDARSSRPNRAGPFGLFQPLADGLKLFMKEEIIPSASSKFLFITGPALAMVTALMTSAVIPWGPSVNLFGRDINLQIAILILECYMFLVW